MVLDYLDIVKRDSKRKRIHARITTDHPASSYGQTGSYSRGWKLSGLSIVGFFGVSGVFDW